ncbi:MAG: hypothetical protein ACKVOK_09965 [Flavobacteriales bacterium]
MKNSSFFHSVQATLPFWIVLIAGLSLFTSHIIGFNFTHFPGDMGDGRLNMYCLEHAHRFMTGQTPSLWEAPFMFPEKKVITYSENLVGSTPVYSVFRLFGADRELAYQLWYVAISILNYTFAFLFLKSFTKNAFAAALGAFVFAFGLSLQSQMTHAQTFPRFAIPLALWLTYLFYRELKLKYFYLLLLAVVYQFYCSIYLGMMLLPVMAILIVSILIFQRKLLFERLRSRYWLATVVSAIAVSGFALIVLMWHYYQRSEGQPVKSLRDVWMTLPTPTSYFYSQPGSLMWDGLSQVGADLPASWDHQLFPGIVCVICVIAFFIIICQKKKYIEFNLPERNWMLALLITMSIAFLLFLKIGGITLYTLLFNLPGFKALRSLTRIINIELIFFACAVALVFLRLLQSEKLKKSTWSLFLVSFALLVADNYFLEEKSYTTPVSEQREEMMNWGKRAEGIPAGSIVSFEVDSVCEDATRHQISAMLCAQDHGLICLNGYTATSPVGFDAYWMNPNEKTRKIWLNRMGFPEDRVWVIKIP